MRPPARALSGAAPSASRLEAADCTQAPPAPDFPRVTTILKAFLTALAGLALGLWATAALLAELLEVTGRDLEDAVVVAAAAAAATASGPSLATAAAPAGVPAVTPSSLALLARSLVQLGVVPSSGGGAGGCSETLFGHFPGSPKYELWPSPLPSSLLVTGWLMQYLVVAACSDLLPLSSCLVQAGSSTTGLPPVL